MIGIILCLLQCPMLPLVIIFFVAFLQVLETLATVVKQESDDENGKKGAVTTNVHGVIF